MSPKIAQVPWNNRLGGVGEAAVKSRLAYFSIPSKYEEDVGIDFYCELIEDDSPSLPFYVQAKGSEHFDRKWGRNIPKSTIIYWLRQQHPVFLIVYDDETKDCFWMSIEDHRYDLIQKIIITDADTIYISVDRANILEQARDANGKFINKISFDSNSIHLFRGQPQFLGKEYVKQIPSAPRSSVEFHQVRENIRAGMYSLIQHHWDKGESEIVLSYSRFLAEFDKTHYNHFVWLGRAAKALGKKDTAREGFKEAIRILEIDENWPNDSKQLIVSGIEAEMQDL